MVVGTTLGSVELEFIKGQPVQVGPKLGRVVVLEVWATWCPPCRDNIPHLTALQHSLPEALIIGVSSEDADKVGKFVTSMGAQMGYRVAVDAGGAVEGLMTRAGARGIPHAFVIDKQSKIVYSGHPAQPDFRAAIEKALREPGPRQFSTRAELEALSVKELRARARELSVHSLGFAEKGDFVVGIVQQQRAELEAMSVRELRVVLRDLGRSAAGCVEKSDMIDAVLGTGVA